MTGYPDSDLMAQALEIGSFTMISKPVDLAQIQKTVDRIVASHRAALGRKPKVVEPEEVGVPA